MKMIEPYTNIPNKWFDFFNMIEHVELHLLVNTIRHTTGYHRLEWETNIIELVELLNISRPSIEKGLTNLAKREAIKIDKKRNDLLIFFDEKSNPKEIEDFKNILKKV